MIDRYGKKVKEVVDIWSDKKTYYFWLLVEIAILIARNKIGEIKREIPPDLHESIFINADKINDVEENITKHNIMAFLQCVEPQFPEWLQSWLHRKVTSSDIIDTALCMQMRDSLKIIINDLIQFMEVIKILAFKHKYTPEIGRTHGIHAEPITFGVKLANYYAELARQLKRLNDALYEVSVGSISGAVGMYTLDPRIEEIACEYLGLRPIISTQIISRDIVNEYMIRLGSLASTIAGIAYNNELLAQTEICEVMEFFSKHQKGSSAMPHKKNPIGSENTDGLTRIVYSGVQVAFENRSKIKNERSIDHSGPERIILPDAAGYVDYAMTRLSGIMKKMLVFPDRMMENLNSTKGLIYSQEVMTLVAEKSGLPRSQAHSLIRDVALGCWEKRSDFLQALLANESIMRYVSEDEVHGCFNLDHKLRHVDFIFEKVFGKE